MKFWLLLVLCAVAAAAPPSKSDFDFGNISIPKVLTEEERSTILNALIRQMFEYLRHIIKNGSTIFGTGPLDPLFLEEFRFYLPAVLINLDLDLKNALATGLGDFIVHKSDVDLRDLTFELEISVPRIEIDAELYDLIGDLYSAIPLYGKGSAKFVVEGFVLRGILYLKQSDDGRSILIDKISKASFEIPYFKSHINGAIGGGDIDAVVNAVTEDVIIGYVNRFQLAIARVISDTIVFVANPILDHLDTWKFIAPLLPKD